VPRLLIIAMHRPDRSPGQRYRFEQYLPDLKAAGFDIDFSYLLDESDDPIFYGPGNWWKKAMIVVRSYRRRMRDARKLDQYDVVLVYREALMTGHTFLERRAARCSARLILDFDDAIWLADTSAHNRRFSFLKRPAKTAQLIALADLVIVGNAHLAAYAERFNTHTVIVPTTIDMDIYDRPVETSSRTPVTIGWTGSPTTLRHFIMAQPVLMRLREKYGDRVRFVVIGAPEYINESLGIAGIPWSADTEVEQLRQLDIGLMPLPDDEWSRGKCACKALQYMALGIPAVASAVGANREVIQHGESGMLVEHDDELFDVLCRLIESPVLRGQLGRAGRQVVTEKYSRQAWRNRYIALFTGGPPSH